MVRHTVASVRSCQRHGIFRLRGPLVDYLMEEYDVTAEDLKGGRSDGMRKFSVLKDTSYPGFMMLSNLYTRPSNDVDDDDPEG